MREILNLLMAVSSERNNEYFYAVSSERNTKFIDGSLKSEKYLIYWQQSLVREIIC